MKQTYRVVINREDYEKYCGCVLCSSSKIIIDFQVPDGITPIVKLEKMEETNDREVLKH